MDAATLTAMRASQNKGSDGDRVFVLNCQTGRNGPAAQYAYEVARMEATRDRAPHTHRRDTRMADRIIELINATDPATSDTTQAQYQSNDEFAEITAIVAAGDPVYATWLYAAGTLFREACGVYPDAIELADPQWRRWFDDEAHPVLTARVLLHDRPMVTIDLGKPVCPVCLVAGSIQAEETATRVSRVGFDGTALYAEYTGGDGTFKHTRTSCLECGHEVRLPGPIGDWL